MLITTHKISIRHGKYHANRIMNYLRKLDLKRYITKEPKAKHQLMGHTAYDLDKAIVALEEWVKIESTGRTKNVELVNTYISWLKDIKGKYDGMAI